MYADYFGFRELPFNNTPDPRFFYSTPDHEEALASLIYAVKERKGFLLLTGEIGAGKTLVTRLMLRHFGSQIAFATIHHAVQTPEDLMESICTEFNLPVQSGMSATQLVRMLHDFLLEQFSQNLPVVLVLDEAQNLGVEAFEQLRMIGNLEADDAKLLQIAIVGQPELQRRFLSPDLRQLRQRLFRTFHLLALNREATKEYVEHRLSVVTDDKTSVFDAGAIEAIWEYSRGVPRIVNTTCDNALLSAYSADQKTIDRAFIESVTGQMMMIGGAHHTSFTEEYGQPRRMPQPNRTEPSPATEPSYTHQAHVEDPSAWRSEPVAPAVSPLASPQSPVAAPQADPQSCRPAHAEPSPSIVQDLKSSSVANQHDLIKTERMLAGRIEESERRLEALEGAERRHSLVESDVQTVRDVIMPLEQEARSVLVRADTTTEILQQRDAQVRKLTTTVKGFVRDLACLLDRTQTVSVDHNNTEDRAVLVHERPAEQTQWSAKVAEELGDLVAQMVGGKSSVRSSVEEAAAVPAKEWIKAGSVSPVKSLPVEVALHDARSDFEDLRRLARAHNSPIAKPDPRGSISATKRLAARVDTLLELIEPAGLSSSG